MPKPSNDVLHSFVPSGTDRRSIVWYVVRRSSRVIYRKLVTNQFPRIYFPFSPFYYSGLKYFPSTVFSPYFAVDWQIEGVDPIGSNLHTTTSQQYNRMYLFFRIRNELESVGHSHSIEVYFHEFGRITIFVVKLWT